MFDVDGTLYDQRPLRRRMLLALLTHCLLHPHDLRLPRLLQTYRRSREDLADEESDQIEVRQYDRPATSLGLPSDEVRQAVETWMHERPLKYLRSCRYPGVGRLFEQIRASGRTIAILSDYPSEAKLRALHLEADLQVAATDADVRRLKPHPLGLQRLLERMRLPADACLYIGDRDERDGACARRLGVHYLIKTDGKDDRHPQVFHHYDELLPWLEQTATG
ncbi:MAG: HAD family hydrolase [Pseudomonadota bacterium]